MKVAIISDTQIGCRNDYLPFLENNRKFFKQIFFPTLKNRGVETIIHLGDLVERRKWINYFTLKHLLEDFLKPAVHNFYLHWILGNHDIYFRNDTVVNASLLLHGPIHVYETAKEISFGDKKVLFVPWLVDSNREEALELIRNTDAKILMGHLELQNFETQPGIKSHDGLDPALLDKFDVVLSGHFHRRQAKHPIYFVGSFAEFSWSEYGGDHGFHIFDTETLEIEFIKNPFTVFAKVHYDDSKGPSPLPDFETMRGKIVKVIISSKTNPSQYDWFVSQIEQAQPLDVIPVEDHLNVHLVTDESITSETKSTLDIMLEYAQQANNITNTDKLNGLLVELFNGAQSLE